VSPDGKVLLYGSSDIMTLPLIGEGKPVAYLQTKYREARAAFSPDGRWWLTSRTNPDGMSSTCKGSRSVAGSRVFRPREVALRLARRREELYWVGTDRTLMAARMELQAAEYGRGERRRCSGSLPLRMSMRFFNRTAMGGGFWCMSGRRAGRTGEWWW